MLFRTDARVLVPGIEEWQGMKGDGLRFPAHGLGSARLGRYLFCMGGADNVSS